MMNTSREDAYNAVDARLNKKPWFITAACFVGRALWTIVCGVGYAFGGIIDFLYDTGDIWIPVLIIVGLCVGVPITVSYFVIRHDDAQNAHAKMVKQTNINHYNTDFKRYCTDLYQGKTYVGSRDVCVAPNGKPVMQAAADNDGSAQHYNSDFSRYCKALGPTAVPVIRVRDICLVSGKVAMQESKIHA